MAFSLFSMGLLIEPSLVFSTVPITEETSYPAGFISILRVILSLGVLCALAWGISSHRRAFPWRVVLGGLGLQVLLAVVLLRIPATSRLFEAFAGQVSVAIGMAEKGSIFLFGSLADASGPVGFVFAFRVLPVIVYFAAVMAVLYHLGIMPRIIAGMAWFMRRTLGVSGSEAVTVSANVLVGQTEAPLCVKPFLSLMTRSQLMVVMASGFATIAGSVFAGYVEFLGGADDARRILFAKHLMTASLMSAPAAFVMAKIILPEMEQEPAETMAGTVAIERPAANAIDAVVLGASDGLRLALNVGAMLVAFVAILALLDWPVAALGDWGPIADWRNLHGHGAWSIQAGLGLLFRPAAWLIGAPSGDIAVVGRLLATSVVATEFVAYLDLSSEVAGGGISQRGTIVVAYALCGFANIPSMAIQVGGLSALAPTRRADISSIAPRALLAGVLACWCTATVASAFVGDAI
mgnify:CR=1 FL=1